MYGMNPEPAIENILPLPIPYPSTVLHGSESVPGLAALRAARRRLTAAVTGTSTDPADVAAEEYDTLLRAVLKQQHRCSGVAWRMPNSPVFCSFDTSVDILMLALLRAGLSLRAASRCPGEEREARRAFLAEAVDILRNAPKTTAMSAAIVLRCGDAAMAARIEMLELLVHSEYISEQPPTPALAGGWRSVFSQATVVGTTLKACGDGPAESAAAMVAEQALGHACACAADESYAKARFADAAALAAAAATRVPSFGDRAAQLEAVAGDRRLAVERNMGVTALLGMLPPKTTLPRLFG